MKKNLALVVLWSAVVLSPGFAQPLTDSASNYTSATWTNNSDLGTGFGPWQLSNTGPTSGRYIGNTGLAANTFGLFSGTNGTSTAIRSFDNLLGINDSFQVQLGYTGVANGGGEIGMNLWSGTNFRLNLKFVGGTSFWTLNDGGTDFSTGIGWAGGSPGTLFNFEFTRRAGNAYSISLVQGAQSYISNNTGTLGTMDISRVEFYSNNQGSGENFGFNNLAVPEPSSASLMALGTAGLLALRRRRSA